MQSAARTAKGWVGVGGRLKGKRARVHLELVHDAGKRKLTEHFKVTKKKIKKQNKVHAQKPGSTPRWDVPGFNTPERGKNQRATWSISNGCCFSPCAGPSLLEVNCPGSAAWPGGGARWSRGARHQSSRSPWFQGTRCPPVRHSDYLRQREISERLSMAREPSRFILIHKFIWYL